MTVREDWSSLPDRELVARASTPDTRRTAVEEICRRHYEPVLRHCARQLREKDSALDAAEDTFEALIRHFATDKTLDNPDALRGFLFTIASRRAMLYMRGGSPGEGHRPPLDLLGVQDVSEMVGDAIADTTDEIAQAEDELGLEHVTHLLDHEIVKTFTPHQQRVYDQAVRHGLTGRELGIALSVDATKAKNQSNHVRTLAWNGFGAFVLFRDGRTHCNELDEIVATGIERDGGAFTQRLREEITRHFDDCPICRNCAVCGPLRLRLIAPYTPALIPFLFSRELLDRIMKILRQVLPAETPHSEQPPPPEEPPAAREQPPPLPASAQGRQRRLGRRPAYVLGVILLMLLSLGAGFILGRSSSQQVQAADTSSPSPPPSPTSTPTPTTPPVAEASIEGPRTFMRQQTSCGGVLDCSNPFNTPLSVVISNCSTSQCSIALANSGWASVDPLIFDGSSWRTSGTVDLVLPKSFDCNKVPRPTAFTLEFRVATAQLVNGLWTAQTFRGTFITTTTTTLTVCPAASRTWDIVS
jgi:DNA-directed RNA polymerase specialized sigma24 family protein